MRAPIFLLAAILVAPLMVQAQLAKEKFQMDGITEVEVRGSFCKVKIDGYNGSTLYFDGVIEGNSGKDYSIEYDRSGSLLKVWIDSPRSSWGSVDCDLTLRVPSTVDVTVDNSSGEVIATGLAGKSLRLEASSGGLEANDIGGDILMKTSSGDIEITGLKGDLEIRSSSGGQRVRDVNGNVEGRSSSGRINLVNIVGDIDAETSSGGITLDGFRGGLKLESTSGSIRGDEVELTADSYFRSSSGSIDMELVNDVQSLNYDLEASSGSIKGR